MLILDLLCPWRAAATVGTPQPRAPRAPTCFAVPMGDEIAGTTFTRAERTRYREKVRRCLDVFERMLSGDYFDGTAGVTGLEIELNLVSPSFQPAMANAEVLDRIADSAFQTELGRYNIELNAPPTTLAGDSLASLEDALRASLNRAD